MKVGVVGVGHVGGSAALNMALRNSCREMVLIDANRQLAVSQALDINQTSAAVSGPKVRAGDYLDLVGPGTGSEKATRMLAVSLPHDDHTWFFKMIGPAELVGKQKAAFEVFVKSVKFDGGKGANP